MVVVLLLLVVVGAAAVVVEVLEVVVVELVLLELPLVKHPTSSRRRSRSVAALALVWVAAAVARAPPVAVVCRAFESPWVAAMLVV